jgi:hypothetical protein
VTAPTLVDDAANPSGQISFPVTSGYTAGYWFTTINDGGSITPVPAASGGSWSYTPVPSPADASIAQAACISGVTSPTEYSEAGEGFNWALQQIDAAADSGIQAPAVEWDISKYTGISFWVYVPADSGAGTQSIRVLFPDKTTDPRGNVCLLDASTPATTCYDSWEKTVPFAPGWQLVQIHFTDLIQLGFGEPDTYMSGGVPAFDAQHSFGVTFQANGPQMADASAGIPFDFCIADLYLTTN